MNYRSCEALNNNFIITDEGKIACPNAHLVVNNSLQRAYIFTNLFFYDITQREVNKLIQKINDRRINVIQSAGFAEDAVDKLLPNLSAQFKTELGDNSLDPLIKVELAKIKKSMVLQLSKSEQKQLDQMYTSICNTEIEKFKKSVIFTKDNNGKPYQVNFSEKYIKNLPERCRYILKPVIKMMAYMDGLKFDQFELSPTYQLTYTWLPDHHKFDEEALKNDIKSLIANETEDDV